MQLNLQDKIAIVTGGAQGIGKSIVETLIAEGARVVIADVKEDQGEATVAELGDMTSFFQCDITNIDQVNALVNGAVDRFGKLDVIVNNAGWNPIGTEHRVTTDKYPIDTWQRVIDIDLNGAFYCCRTAAALMVKQGFGSIVNISSVAGVVALRLQIGFVAAKAAVLKMTEAMACELGPMGVRVNAVSPGSTLTEPTRRMFETNKEGYEKLVSFIPQRRLGETSEMADAVTFLASDAASYINGQNIVVDGGWTCGFNRDF
ncbi:MAG: SDR family NAD(P)-dependent oxidoreductase [Armatimonadota bacterium]